MTVPVITACICTLDRQSGLETAFESLLLQVVDKSRVELLIVDNGSDAYEPISVCEKLVARAANAGFNARFEIEPQRGLSNARNCGINSSSSHWLAYVDDDEIVSVDYLSSLLSEIDECSKDVGDGVSSLGCLGGPLVLCWPNDVAPIWYSDHLSGYFTGLDYGRERRDLDPQKELLFGGNLIVHRETVENLGGFNLKLDRKGHSSLLGLGDTLIQIEIAKTGRRIRYVPDATIDHIIPPERTTIDWIIARAYGQGQSDFNYRFILRGHGRIRQSISAFREWVRRHRELAGALDNATGSALNDDQKNILAKVHTARFKGTLKAVFTQKL